MEKQPVAAPRRPKGSGQQESERTPSLDSFQKLYEDSITITSKAQDHDETGNKDAACIEYKKALDKIMKAFEECSILDSIPSGDIASQVEQRKNNLEATRALILERICTIQNGDETQQDNDDTSDLPSYDEAIASASSRNSSAKCASAMSPTSPYFDVARTLDEIAEQENAQTDINAIELFSIKDKVKMYHIAADGEVTTRLDTTSLRIIAPNGEAWWMLNLEKQSTDATGLPSFIQIGTYWSYPLIPNHSPILKSSDRTYIFPDVSNELGGSIGICLEDEIPDEAKDIFEDIILQILSIKGFHSIEITTPDVEQAPLPGLAERPIEPSKQAVPFSAKLTKGLISGAEAISKALEEKSITTSGYMDKTAAYLQSKINPTGPPVISQDLKKNLKRASYITEKAVHISGGLVTHIGNATAAVGEYLAPKIHKAATKLVARTSGSDEKDASSKVNQALEVGSGALIGFGTVYMGLENSAKILASSLSNNTVRIVEHRYGHEAAEVASDTADTVGNAAMTAWNAKSLAPKSIAKKAAKEAGKKVIHKYGDKPNENDTSP